MINNLFTFSSKDYKDLISPKDLQDADYEMISLEFGKPINTYQIRQELYSDAFWKFLRSKYTINENEMIIDADIDVDEKQKTHKTFKYIIKINSSNKNYFYISFYDEIRGYDDTDYHDFATKQDKENKISSLSIYYDNKTISFKDMEKEVEGMIKCSYSPSNKNQFFTIQTSQYGFQLKASYVKDMDIDLKLNYGKKFIPVYDDMVEKLSKTKHGLFLLHGSPGTGKTTILRKLISVLENKTIIYVPTYMMSQIADPELITFISQFKDTILVLEDSENILANSIDNRSQAVSNILNMTDGLLNDSMEIQIIATFNTNKKMIDDALTRAGRLQVDYKFGKLSKENSQKLIENLELDKSVTKPMSLAEIYEGHNQTIVDDLENTEKKIGF